ncbi:SDR family NAD(P)-dependent oxidoreductase [Gimesia aquarii]|uniref:3-oxoacyl-[acyl-carrier-protein] reductase FabG n=1 Tax=Gimesia aquarii TaxID=2527964 RepID=A0A517WRW4_9PLAN|nr:SDR family oxidoreductase [Gimesia aquarii]QDU07993.1 3-oxoacyl-[acyl-carrier-protein] reductase FabG [Gimesia aquarii]
MNSSHSEIEQQNFVVLGATGSVGSDLSRRLISAGHHVLLGGRDKNKLQELGAELDAPFANIDASEFSSIEECLQAAHTEYGRVDGVVNCIGSVLLKPAHLTSDEEWQETLTTNLSSAFVTVRSASKVMRQTGGAIVLVSSAAARIGFANHEAIAAAKAGIIGLTLSSAATYANRGIRVNAVAPGLIKSNMTKKLWETPTAQSTSAAMHALDRIGEPSDVASMIAWLLQPATSWITGQVLGVDGGLATIAPRHKQKATHQ